MDVVRSEPSALVERCGGRGDQPVGLVVDVRGDRTEGVPVLATVVGAEEQLTTGHEENTDVRLGAATVAAVGGGERRGRECSCHETFLRRRDPAA
jgi:hypothetical protein